MGNLVRNTVKLSFSAGQVVYSGLIRACLFETGVKGAKKLCKAAELAIILFVTVSDLFNSAHLI